MTCGSSGAGTGTGMDYSIPEVREREGNGRTHSLNLRMGREWEKSIPEIREWERNEKNPFPQFGNWNQRLSSPRIPGNGNGNEKKHNMTIKKYLENMWREKEFWTKNSQSNPPPFLIIPSLLVLLTATINEQKSKQNDLCRTLWRSDHEVHLSRHPPPPTHPRHLAQRLKAALPTVPSPQTHTFSESWCQ